MTENQYDAIVIGAGHNGLVTAGYLARDGLSVLVLERLDKVGGVATTDEFSPGFMAPTCAYSGPPPGQGHRRPQAPRAR